jgi:hypothetical protein
MRPGIGLFRPLKKYVAGMWIGTDAGVKQAVTSWLRPIETDFFYTELQVLVP